MNNIWDHTAQNSDEVKLLVNRLFQSFGKENFGEFTIIISHFGEAGI